MVATSCCPASYISTAATSLPRPGRARRSAASRCATNGPVLPLVPVLVAAQSRLIVDGLRFSSLAIVRNLQPCRCRSAIATRSSSDKYRGGKLVLSKEDPLPNPGRDVPGRVRHVQHAGGAGCALVDQEGGAGVAGATGAVPVRQTSPPSPNSLIARSLAQCAPP